MCKLFKPKDWYPVWSDQVKWDIKTWNNELRDYYWHWEWLSYKIIYSPSRKRYKLKTNGFKPKEHPAYHQVVQILNDFINV